MNGIKQETEILATTQDEEVPMDSFDLLSFTNTTNGNNTTKSSASSTPLLSQAIAAPTTPLNSQEAQALLQQQVLLQARIAANKAKSEAVVQQTRNVVTTQTRQFTLHSQLAQHLTAPLSPVQQQSPPPQVVPQQLATAQIIQPAPVSTPVQIQISNQPTTVTAQPKTQKIIVQQIQQAVPTVQSIQSQPHQIIIQNAPQAHIQPAINSLTIPQIQQVIFFLLLTIKLYVY